jgi:23S rRNA pseudouridine2605 synthase
MKAHQGQRKKPPHQRPAAAGASLSGERLQKVLAAAGIGSRRQCEELIRTGRVEVDRKVVTELGTRVDPARQQIRVDGSPLVQPHLAYYALHKPAGVLSTNRDPSGRPRVIDLVPAGDQRLFCVGRLDLHSEGLILVTNDGELANRLTHPRFGVPKTYRVVVAGQPTREVLDQLLKGVHLAEGLARAQRVTVKRQQKQSTILEIVLDEGRNREIRRVLARVGHKVLRLTRIAVGPVRLGKLPSGAHRRLGRQEVDALWQAVKRKTERRDVEPR